MLNIPDLRKKFHDARLKDSSIADLWRRHGTFILDELEAQQAALAESQQEIQKLQAEIEGEDTRPSCHS